MITIDIFKNIEKDTVFAVGDVQNSSDSQGIYLTDSREGDWLRWIAKKGFGEDWAIYAYWADKSDEWIERYGQKVYSVENIRKLVPCDDEVIKIYRL